MNLRRVTFGFILILIGLILTLKSLGVVFLDYSDLSKIVLALALIMLGFWIIIRKTREDKYAHQPPPPPNYATGQAQSDQQGSARQQSQYHHDFSQQAPPKSTAAPEFRDGQIKFSKSIGDLFVDCKDLSLQNMVVSLGVGDAEIKLQGGVLAPGLNRLIVTGFLGDIRIFAPFDMPIYIHTSNTIGDIEILGRRTSGVGNELDSQTGNYNEAEQKLYIAVSHFVGDIRMYQV